MPPVKSINIEKQLPPQSIESEEAVIGAILNNPASLLKVTEVLSPEHFYKPAHKLIYEAMRALMGKNAPIDMLTVSEYLKANDKIEMAGGRQYINEIAINNPTSANITYYANIIKECAIKRSLINAGSEIISIAHENYPTEVCLSTAQSLVFDIAQQKASSDMSAVKDLVIQSFQQIEYRCEHKDELLGVGTGFYDLDAVTIGLRPSDLIILAARPSMGKTAFALNIAQTVATKTKKPVAIFSLEMPKSQLMIRMLAAESEVESKKISSGNLQSQDWDKLTQAMECFQDAPLWIDDTPSLTVMDMRAKCRRLMMEVKDLSLIVVDYLQLMQGDTKFSNDRNQEISAISRGLKALARELNVPIIALSQLSRETEKRGDKMPMLSDLRDSGAIEQDADIVMFIHRPEYYDDKENPNPELKGKAQIIIAKHRNGEVGTINMLFQSNITKFKNANKTDVF